MRTAETEEGRERGGQRQRKVEIEEGRDRGRQRQKKAEREEGSRSQIRLYFGI